MSALNDSSRRFFAEFIASRIKAWSLHEGRPPSSGGPVAGTSTPAASANPEPEAETGPAGAGPDGRRPRVPDRSDRHTPPDQGTE